MSNLVATALLIGGYVLPLASCVGAKEDATAWRNHGTGGGGWSRPLEKTTGETSEVGPTLGTSGQHRLNRRSTLQKAIHPTFVGWKACQNDPKAAFGVENLGRGLGIDWSPVPGRYLFPLCSFGKLTNHILCMKKYAWFAALLNRTLIFPRIGSEDGDLTCQYSWKWDSIYNSTFMDDCLAQGFGKKREDLSYVISEEQFLALRNGTCVGLDAMALLTGFNRPYTPLKAFGLCQFMGSIISTPKVTPGGFVEPTHVNSSVLMWLRRMTDDYEVLSLGRLFFENFQSFDWYVPELPYAVQPGPPLATRSLKCKNIWSPPNDLQTIVDSIIHDFSNGKPFAAVHLRSAHIIGKINYAPPEVHDAAIIIGEWLRPMNVSVLYVATAMNPEESGLLKELIQAHLPSRGLTYVTMRQELKDWPPRISQLENSPSGVVLATVEKLVCAQAEAFLGTTASTYSQEVVLERLEASKASCQDGFLQALELPV